METKRICPSCQKTLPPNVPLGLCPECLIKSGFNTGTEPGNPGKGTGFVPPPVEELRKLFPQLEIVELIGKGGMGAVYRARQPTLDRFVALKILPPGAADDTGFAERFNREARALARLNHPHIVAVHDFGQAGDQPYLVMEFVDGPNLRQVEQAGRLSPEQALEIVPQICEALQFAHNEGVVHRDIKPENILLDKKGRVKITDFGIAKILGAPWSKVSLTGAKDLLGTPRYMAPEQVEKPQTVDHRADIYSLGVVFYEMLTGELPLGRFAPPSQRVQMDVRLDEVVLRTLEKQPELRYQQVSQVKTCVETIVASGSNAGVPPAGADATCGRAERELKRGGIVLAGRRNGQRVIVWRGVANTFFAILGCVLITMLVLWFFMPIGTEQFILGILLAVLITAGGVIMGFKTPFQQLALLDDSPPGSSGRESAAGIAVAIALVLSGGLLTVALIQKSTNSAPSPAVAAHNPSFGPAIERVVTNMIDFDSGALVDLPLPTQPGERDQERYDWINGEGKGVPWMRAHGIDAIDGNHALIGVDLLVVPLESKDWRGLTPAELRSKLDGLQLPRAPLLSIIPEERRPFGFQTREGALGIFEITNANLPRGVNIRYKLAQFSSAGDSRTFTSQQAGSDILRLKLGHAEEDAALAEAKFKVGMIPRSDLQAAKDNVALLQAEIAGDAIQVAQVRLTAAENQLAASKALFDIGLIPNSEYQAAQNAVELRQAELRAVRAARSVAPSAIPVIERQLRTAGDAAEDRVLDLDDGRLLSVPTNVIVASVNNPRPLLNWMVEHGADLLVTDDPSSTNLNFHLDDGRLLRPADSSTFDGITVSASDVGRQLAQREASQDADLPKVDVGAQPVFLFKTREGGVGVLQILDLTDNPRGAKIRYRIVRVAGAKNLQWKN